MKTLPWRRQELIRRIRSDLWRYLTPAADIEQAVLEASALLRMRPAEVRRIGSLQFLVSAELGAMLDDLPVLFRRLATTTTAEEETSAERVRGSIQWGRTLGLRFASGIPHIYVTAPSRRAYQTPENELLVFLLDQTVSLGQGTGWHQSTSEHVGRLIRDRVSTAIQLSRSRMLMEVDRNVPGPRALARVRAGRYRRRYQSVLDAYRHYVKLVGHLDRDAIRHAVETHGVASRDDATLFELYCTFATLAALQATGWKLGRLGLFAGSLRLAGRRGREDIEVSYQTTPLALSAESVYRDIQRNHVISPGGLRPDLVIRRSGPDGEDRWLLIEAKGGDRSVVKSARAAAYDLLAYRSAFAPILDRNEGTYGLGIAWGSGLNSASAGDVRLCTPDKLQHALGQILG